VEFQNTNAAVIRVKPVLASIIAILDTSGLDRKRRSVHYKTMPSVTNVQVNWAVKERWI
jgi:hypothetical protein